MKFSIILPVRNGGEYVKACVKSVLAQDFTDFNLLILDNNSNDGTSEWLVSVSDPRILVFRSSEPLPIEKNWQRIISIPKNEFITLIGHDDLLSPDYLVTMNELITKYPDASLYQTHFDYINATGQKIRSCQPMLEKESAVSFLENFLLRKIDVMGTGFMMRAADYEKIGGIPDYPNLLFADFELWINLAAKSYKATSGKKCFSFRIHESMTTQSADIKYHHAFERFIHFLVHLRNSNAAFKNVIEQYSQAYLLFYCQGLSHRLLRTPIDKRQGLSINKFIEQCKGYSRALGIEDRFHPTKNMSINAAKWIDRFSFSRALFLRFKKMFPKPLLK